MKKRFQVCIVNLIKIWIKLFLSTKKKVVKTIVVKRILRHKEPVIIIPYYKNTREEEVVVKMIENYNKDLIQVIKNINDIKI